MLLFVLACQINKNDLDSGIQDPLKEEQESSCFSSAPSDPFLVYATPYDANGNQANHWHLQPKGEETIDFSMGRAISGQVHISQDGSWGAVAHGDGTLGIFRYEDGSVSVLEESLTVEADGQNIYASTLWLDSHKGDLWITDPNWPDNGGGLFRAELDCGSGRITSAEKVFSSKNGYGMQPFGENWVYLAREINNEPYQISIFDGENLIAQGNAFDDDESIFSALASDGVNILAADNNEFSSISTRISHSVLDGDTLVQEHAFDIEDPIGIAMVDDWALIASGYGNAVWEYHLSTHSLRSVMDIPLPSSILRQGNDIYVAGNTQISIIEMSGSGAGATEAVLELSGMEGIVGAFGIFGDFSH